MERQEEMKNDKESEKNEPEVKEKGMLQITVYLICFGSFTKNCFTYKLVIQVNAEVVASYSEPRLYLCKYDTLTLIS